MCLSTSTYDDAFVYAFVSSTVQFHHTANLNEASLFHKDMEIVRRTIDWCIFIAMRDVSCVTFMTIP